MCGAGREERLGEVKRKMETRGTGMGAELSEDEDKRPGFHRPPGARGRTEETRASNEPQEEDSELLLR